jgi:DNA-binding transcriptional regulator YiaG
MNTTDNTQREQAHDTSASSANAPGTSTTAPGASSASAPTRDSLATIKPTPDQIRAARTLAGQSQEEAAQLVHVTGRAWRRWESGEREISGACWELYLIKALGFTPIK